MNKGSLKGIKGFPQIDGNQTDLSLDREDPRTLKFFYPGLITSNASPNAISGEMQLSSKSLVANQYIDTKYDGIPATINQTTSTIVSTSAPRNAKFISQQVNEIAFGNNIFLAANTLGISLSTDGIIWTTSSLALANTISFGNGIFVAGTTTGGFLTSSDGTSWTTATLSQFPATSVTSIAYGNSLWAAVGQAGSINVSTDNGVTWNSRVSGVGVTSINSIAFGNGIFVAGYNSSSASRAIITSTDGITWTTNRNAFTTSITSVDFGNGIFVAGGITGFLRTSTDGISWTSRNSTFGSTSISSLAYLNGLWLAGGPAGKFSTSTNGVTWDTANFVLPNQIFSIAYGNSKYMIGTTNSRVRYSTDLVNWNFASEELVGSNNLAVFGAYGNGISLLWVTSPTLDIRKSIDGSRYYENVESLGGSTTITNLLFGKGQFVLNSAGIWKTSTDAVSWTTISTPALTPSKWFGNGQKWVSSTGSAFSSDLITWVTSEVSVPLLGHLSYNPYVGKWLYTNGLSAAMYVSEDAVTWTTAFLPWPGSRRTFPSDPYVAPSGQPGMSWWNGYQTIFKGATGLYLGNTEGSIWSTDLITFRGSSFEAWYYNANSGSTRVNIDDVFVSEQGNNSGRSYTWNGTNNQAAGPTGTSLSGPYLTRGYNLGEYIIYIAGSNTFWAENGAGNNIYRYKLSDSPITINGLTAKVIK